MTTPELVAIAEPRNWSNVARVLERRKHPEDAPVLLDAVRQGTPHQRSVALRVLSALGDARALDDAVAIVKDPKLPLLRTMALDYIGSLPPATTLDRARQWIEEPWPLALAGQAVLERHATRDDLPVLRERLTTAFAQEDVYRACFAVDALGRLGALEALPELRHFYEATASSYGRWRAAQALARIEGDFAGRTAIECLYDCEPSTRLLGIQHAARTPEVVDRVRRLAADPAEDRAVVEAARTRSDGPSIGEAGGP
jgi:HEAT repeat protein